MKKRFILLSGLLILGIGAGAVTYAISPTVHTGETGEAPELGRTGDFPIGTITANYVLPDRIAMTAWGAVSGNLQRGDRNLSVRFWYPAELASKPMPVTYSHEMKPAGQEPLTITYQGKAVKDMPAISDQKFPLILMSHGFGGWNTQLSNLGEHLASHGYVVASIEHADQPVDGVPSLLLSFGNVLASRMLDQRQVLKKILASTDTPFGQIDTEKIGLIGYSMGGFGALASAGAGYDFDSEPMSNVPEAAQKEMIAIQQTDSPIDAFVAIAPWGGQPDNRAWTSQTLRKIKQPFLIISGSEDDVVNHEEGVSWLFENTTNSNRHMLVYREARHNIAGNDFAIPDGTPFQFTEFLKEPVWRTERINAINQHFVTAFFDWRLKGESGKSDYLDVPTTDSNDADWSIGFGEQLNGKLAGDGETDYWKGFQRQWMTGLDLHRANPKTPNNKD